MILLKGGMDVNTDGIDGDRNFDVDITPMYFQAQTTYKWRRKTNRPSPAIAKFQERIAKVKTELATPKLSADKTKELNALIKTLEGQIADIKYWSFLISEADPSIVVPTFMLKSDAGKPAPIQVGDYAVVVARGKLYPCIVGDAGPNSKWGEASLRICKAINPRASATWRAVSDLDVAFLVFPNSADPATTPDYAHWRERCAALLAEIGYPDAPLEHWENIIPPWPDEVTPTELPEPPEPPESSESPSPPEPEKPDSVAIINVCVVKKRSAM